MQDYTLNKKIPLLPEQNDCVDFMLKHAQCINAAQTGLGKTYSSCTAVAWMLLKYKDLHAFLIVPKKAVKAFKKELSTKLKLKFNIMTNDEYVKIPGCRITLMTHTALEKYSSEILKLKMNGAKLLCLMDECHNGTQDHDSKFYKTIASLRKCFTIFWGLTATPLKNDIEGFYWMSHIVHPGFFGSWNTFKNSFLRTEMVDNSYWISKGGRKVKKTQFDEIIIGYKNLDFLTKKINEFIIFKQREYKLNFIYDKVLISNVEKDNYMKAGLGLMRKSAKKNWAVRLHDLQKVVDNIEENHRTVELVNKERLFLKVLKECTERNEVCLVYCDYNEVVSRLEYLIDLYKSSLGISDVYKVTGDISQSKREKVEDLLGSGKVVLITSAGTESINLQKANTLIFYDSPFSIATFIQAVGRVTRVDSKFDHQNVHIIEAFGTIDTYKRCLIELNGAMIESLFGKIATLPLDIAIRDRDIQQELRDGLLWAFKKKRLLTENDLQIILSGKKLK